MLRATPPGEDGLKSPKAAAGETDEASEIENKAQDAATGDVPKEEGEGGDSDDEKPADNEFLEMVREADSQALHYISQVNRKSWERGYRAYHQQHFDGSKYKTDDYKNRSRLFIPKTRTAIRKDMAAVAASLFGSIDSVNCMPGNEADPQQRASAAVVQELVNYRTDRQSSKASIPWFHVAMGARQTSLITGICLSKQSWKLELKKKGSEKFRDNEDDEQEPEKERDVFVPAKDRPDSELIPPENFVIDPAADWTNPAQDAAYIIIKWPMRLDEIRRKQKDPRRPWKPLPESVLKSAGEGAQMAAAAVRRSREQGIDRFDDSQNMEHFDIIWIWESFIRTAGQDWTFLSVGDQHMLTDPVPVEEAYPEQFGERPLAMGYGSIEAFRIFPMASVEAWQMLQQESNDIRNLALDSLKQNIMPVTKVVRGRNVDLDQLKRRGQGTAIMVTGKDDVTWEKVQDIGGSVQAMTQKLDIEFDDLSGQQNYGTVQDNNNLGKTLGGLKLAAGAANAVQEFDIRIWIETWCEVVLTQIVRLEQYYESDPVVLGLCADRAKLLQKHGIDQLTDELLEDQVNVRVNVGLGAGDPQQRLAKFQSATQVAMPYVQLDPDFKSGKKVVDIDAVFQEVFGAAGYRDGGQRFFKEGAPQGPNPAMDANVDKLKSEAERNRGTAKAAIVTALSNAAKVGLGQKELEDAYVDAQFQRHLAHVDQMGKSVDLGMQHGHALADRQKAAQGLGPDGSPLAAPGEGGDGAAAAGPASPAGGDTVPPASPGGAAPAPVADAGAGNMGVNPATLAQHSVPAGDAGQQGLQDEAAAAKQIAKTANAPKNRTVTVAARGPDGRASQFHVQEHPQQASGEAAQAKPAETKTEPTHGSAEKAAPASETDEKTTAQRHRERTISQLRSLVGQLNAPKRVVRDKTGWRIETDHQPTTAP